MLKLNVEMLAHAYDYLNTQPPFSSWNLPHSEDIRFEIKRKPKFYAECRRGTDGVYRLIFSICWVGRHDVLMSTMAHEMIHIHVDQACMNTRNHHDRTFQRLADRVCKIHEFDRLIF